MRPFNDPPTGTSVSLQAICRLFFADPSDVRQMAISLCTGSTGGTVVPLVQTEILGSTLTNRRTFHHDGFYSRLQQLRVMHVRPDNHNRQRTAPTLEDHAVPSGVPLANYL